MNKVCNKCGIKKSLDLFAKGKGYRDGIRNTCKKCHSDYMVNYYKNNDDKRIIKNKINSGKDFNWKRHKITKEKFDEMVSRYSGKCYACKINDASNIDHDHNCCSGSRSCGSCVRGILCHQCNTALGLVKDSKKTLQRLIEYL
jgi:hypothetical protein